MVSKKTAGAQISRASFQAKSHAAFLEHRRIAIDSLKRLLAQPVSTMMTCAVIAIALALPLCLYVALANVQQLSQRWDGELHIAVFMQASLDEAASEKLMQAIKKWPEIAQVSMISKAQGLAEFEKLTGMQEVLATLEKNPLPVVLEVRAKSEFAAAQDIAKIVEKLQALEAVDEAKLDLEWVKRLQAIIKVAERVALMLAMMLSIGVLLVIANTIRLEIENRRREIVVIKLIGGTDSFIRRPFLYAGFWYGLGGGILSTILVVIALAMVNPAVSRLAGLYDSDYALFSLPMADALSLWVLAAVLGYFGAWFTTNRHLDQLDIR